MEARLVGELHVCVPEHPQEGAVDPLATANGMEEGGVLLFGRIEVSKSLKAEQWEPPEVEPPLRIDRDV